MKKELEKQMSELQHKLNGVRSAAKALGHSAAVEVKGAKKRVLSAAGRAAIAKAARKRWAKVRKQTKKVVSEDRSGQYEDWSNYISAGTLQLTWCK